MYHLSHSRIAFTVDTVADYAKCEPEVALAELAADLGYADQAHFTRDFGKVVGQPPGDYRRSLGVLPAHAARDGAGTPAQSS